MRHSTGKKRTSTGTKILILLICGALVGMGAGTLIVGSYPDEPTKAYHKVEKR